jgi:hypothetical protein
MHYSPRASHGNIVPHAANPQRSSESERFEIRKIYATDGVCDVGKRVAPGIAVVRGIASRAGSDAVKNDDDCASTHPADPL